MKTKRLLAAGVIFWASLSGLSACSTTSPYTYQGAAAGGALGAVAGALIDGNNRWRGAVIGGALGSAMGAATTEISARSTRQAGASNQPVYYPPYDARNYRKDYSSHW